MARPKLRRTLGDANSPEAIKLMRLMGTQSRMTLAAWAVDYASDNYLPIYEAEAPGDGRLRFALNDCRAHIAGELPAARARAAMREALNVAREQAQPAAQAAARAIATSCAAVRTPTSALGFLFYGAAAVAYSIAGTSRAQGEYDALAAQEFERAYAALECVAQPDEPNPARLDWNC